MPSRCLALLALPAVLLAAADDGAKPRKARGPSEVEQRVMLKAYDADKNGELSADERAKAIAEHKESIRSQIKDPERAKALLDGEGEVHQRRLLALIAGKMANQAWFASIGDKTLRQEKSPQDLIEVQTTHSLPVGGGFRAYVKVRWGDLDNKIEGGGKQFYSDWAGNLNIQHGTATVTRKLAFDDGKAKAPKVGSGADRLDDAGGDSTVRWTAATVGWTDGLIIQLDLPHPASGGTVTAGGLTIHFAITPTPNGVELPDGRSVQQGGLIQ